MMPTDYNHSQTHLYIQLSAYLQQIGVVEGQARENNLNLGGDCTGWSFLYGYYKSINKSQNFNEIKNYISKWDGQLSSLNTNLGMSEALKNKYPTGQKLFEQTINDVVWFSQVKSKKIADLSQNDRVEQYEFAADKHYELKNIFSFLRKDYTNITAQELPDMLKIAQLWKNSWLDLGIYGENKDSNLEGHALSIYIDNNGHLHYFNCNHTQISTDDSSPEAITSQVFKAISSWKNLTLNDFSLYQLTNKNQFSNENVSVDLNINKNVQIKFLDMAIKSHQLEPVYKILASDKQHAPELIKLYENPLFKQAKEAEHTEMLDLLLRNNSELENSYNKDIFNNLSKLFNSLSLSDLLDFNKNDILTDSPKGMVSPIEFNSSVHYSENNLLADVPLTAPEVLMGF